MRINEISKDGSCKAVEKDALELLLEIERRFRMEERKNLRSEPGLEETGHRQIVIGFWIRLLTHGPRALEQLRALKRELASCSWIRVHCAWKLARFHVAPSAAAAATPRSKHDETITTVR